MKRIGLAAGISALAHILLLSLVVFLWKPSESVRNHSVSLIMMPEPAGRSKSDPQIDNSEPDQSEQVKPGEKTSQLEPYIDAPEHDEEKTDERKGIAWQSMIQNTRNREMLLSAKSSSSEDSLLRYRFNAWVNHAADEGLRDPGQEDADRAIEKRASGTSIMKVPSGILDPLISKAKSPPAPLFDFIPTRTQVEALACLFHTRRATQMTIYESLRSSNVTAQGLDRELERLVDKGYIRKKKISPENILLIATPVGAFPIEMSRKNLLNPLWEYELQIERPQLMHYLQSRLTVVEDAEAAGDSTKTKAIENLKGLMELLAKEPAK